MNNNDDIIRDVIGAKAPQIFFVQTVRAREAIVEGLNAARQDERNKIKNDSDAVATWTKIAQNEERVKAQKLVEALEECLTNPEFDNKEIHKVLSNYKTAIA